MICKILKLSTGETIIASIETESATYVDILRPIKIILVPHGKESFNVLMVKWDLSINFELPVRVFKTSIVSVSEPEISFKESYADIFNDYENEDVEDELQFDDIKDVDDLSKELEKIVSMMKSSANTTLHWFTPDTAIVHVCQEFVN